MRSGRMRCDGGQGAEALVEASGCRQQPTAAAVGTVRWAAWLEWNQRLVLLLLLLLSQRRARGRLLRPTSRAHIQEARLAGGFFLLGKLAGATLEDAQKRGESSAATNRGRRRRPPPPKRNAVVVPSARPVVVVG